MEDVQQCPRCHSDEVIPIVYGVPTPKMLEDSWARRMALGGRVAWPGAPDYACRNCGHDWRDDEAGS